MSNTFIKKNLENIKPQSFDWSIIQAEMKNKLGLDVYESWLKKIEFLEEFNNYILISVPTRFIRDWITSRYLDQILQIIKLHKKEIIRIEFKIKEQSLTKVSEKNNINDDESQENILRMDIQHRIHNHRMLTRRKKLLKEFFKLLVATTIIIFIFIMLYPEKIT